MTCPHCSTASRVPSLPPLASNVPTQAQAVTQRLISLVVDFLIGIALLGVGWLVWAGLLVSRGQTPAGRIFSLSFVDNRTGRQPSTAKLIVRLCVVFAFGVYLVAGALWGYGLLIDVGGYWVHSRAIPSVMLVLVASDLFALTFSKRQRLLDRVLRIAVSPAVAVAQRP